MPRPVQIVKDMEFDEVSLVDRAACPPAAIVIAKRADQEDGMTTVYDEDGNELDLSDLPAGTIIEDETGQQFEVAYADDEDDDTEPYVSSDEGELAAVGKSAFFEQVENDVVAGIRAELAKAMTDDDRMGVVSKAVGALAKRAAYAESKLIEAAEIAKSERDLRLTREYIAKAAEYNVPVDPEELGPVLMRATEALSYDDCAVIHKALVAAGEMLYTEAGYDSRGAVDDPMAEIDSYLDDQVAKSAGGVSKAGAITAFFDANPDQYDAYRADRTR